MKGKHFSAAIGLAVLGWHILALIQDAERCKQNWDRWRGDPSYQNLVRLLMAEGVLARDIGWLL